MREPQEKQAGLLVIYSGPSGVGKGTVLKPYLARHAEAMLSVSMTTRAPRAGEQDGVDYFFVTREVFEAQIANDGLLEYAQYSGNYYGTPRAAVERELAAGRDVVLEIEVQGALKVMQAFPGAVPVFILPPSYAELRTRLTGRGTEPPEVVERRLETARSELELADRYRYLIVNRDIETSIVQLEAVITAEKCKLEYMKPILEKVCDFA